MSIPEIVKLKTQALPDEKQRMVLAYVEELEQNQHSDKAPLRSLYGILADRASDLSEEDFRQARREMWANFPRDFTVEE